MGKLAGGSYPSPHFLAALLIAGSPSAQPAILGRGVGRVATSRSWSSLTARQVSRARTRGSQKDAGGDGTAGRSRRESPWSLRSSSLAEARVICLSAQVAHRADEDRLRIWRSMPITASAWFGQLSRSSRLTQSRMRATPLRRSTASIGCRGRASSSLADAQVRTPGSSTREARERVRDPRGVAASRAPAGVRQAAMPTIGRLRCVSPVEPENRALPNAKIPPSEATSQ